MAFAKRIFLFLLTNILVITVISFILWIFNVQPYLQANGLNYGSLAIFCLVWGMGGALISLGLSRIMAKWTMGVQLIDPQTRNAREQDILKVVYGLAQKAGLPDMPEVGIYDSPEVNAFATGPTKRRALVAISSGLLARMNREEMEAVLGHEISHVANGDMVTMTLLQGIVNAFVMFLARILAFALSQAFSKGRDEERSNVSPFIFQLMVFVFQMVFMVLGSIVIAAFCRYREFRADAGGASLVGNSKMIAALQALKRTVENQEPQQAQQQQPAFQILKISNYTGVMRLFASHPPLDERIARLQQKGRF